MSIIIESPTAETGPATAGGTEVVDVAGWVVDAAAGDGVGLRPGPLNRVEPGGAAVVGVAPGPGGEPDSDLAAAIPADGSAGTGRWERPRPTRATSTATSVMPMIRSTREISPIETSVPCSEGWRWEIPARSRPGDRAGRDRRSSPAATADGAL